MELFEPDIDRISEHVDAAMEMIPCLQHAEIKNVTSGPITYAPENIPYIGPYLNLPNYWLAAAFGYEQLFFLKQYSILRSPCKKFASKCTVA